MSTRVANLAVRTVYRREGITLLSSGQRRCFSCSSICGADETLTGKRMIPSVQDWDGILITPPILRQPKAQSRPGPGAPIRDASEFKPNTLSRDLAAQRVQQPSEGEYTTGEKGKRVEASGGEGKGKGEWKSGSGSGDMGLIRRKQDQKAQRKGGEGVDAAMQNFQKFGRDSGQQQARASKRPGDARDGQKQKHSATTARNAQNTKVSRRRNPKFVAGEEYDIQKASFEDSHPSTPAENADTMNVFDGDNFALETPLRLKRPDAVIATKDEALPDTLAILGSQVFFDADVDSQVEEFVGDYNVHFSAQKWESAHKEGTGKAISPLDYASFAIARNVTLNEAKKRRSVNTIKQFLQRPT